MLFWTNTQAMNKTNLVKSALEEFEKIYDGNLEAYGPEWFTFDKRNKTDIRSLISKQITLAYEEGKKEGK